MEEIKRAEFLRMCGAEDTGRDEFYNDEDNEEARWLFREFEEAGLYLYLTLARARTEGKLKEEIKKRLLGFRELVKDKETGICLFVSTYLGYWIDKLDKENKEISRDELLKSVSDAAKVYNRPNAISELRADILFMFEDGYMFGVMHYNSAVENLNARAAEKLAEYWRDINKDKKREENCLRAALNINEGLLGANYYLGRILEDRGEVDEAVLHFKRVLKEAGKKADIFLNPEEFYFVCSSRKHLGCVFYKDKKEYGKGIGEFKEVLKLWNGINDNAFVQSFPEELRDDVAMVFRRVFGIGSILVSLRKIYSITGDKKKEEKCTELFLKKAADLVEIPLDEV